MPLPWMHCRPASMTSHFELSIMIGTRAISGSPAIRFRKRTIAALLSSMASSMLMSMTCAPFSTCWRATPSASSNSPFRIMRAKAFEPVTLVRSPMLTNSAPAPISTGSRPDSFIGGTGTARGSHRSIGVKAAEPTAARSGSGERGCGRHRAGTVPEPGSLRTRGPAVATLLGQAEIVRERPPRDARRLQRRPTQRLELAEQRAALAAARRDSGRPAARSARCAPASCRSSRRRCSGSRLARTLRAARR